MSNNKTKVVTGKVRLSFANVWEPKAIGDGKPKFSVSILIDKNDTDTLSRVNAAIDAAIDEGIGKFGGRKPNRAVLKTPLRDGDVEKPEDEAYAGKYFINANSNTAPQIVDKNVQPILEHSEIYSGVYARVSLSFYAFNSNGNKGIACGLGNIQKLQDGEPLGGHTSPEKDFDVVEEEFL